MKKILLIILPIIILVALAGIYGFNFTDEDIYVTDDVGEVIQIDDVVVGEYGDESTEEELGFIKNIFEEGGKTYIDIDYVQWFEGDECEKRGLDNPNVFCISNENPKIRTFEVTSDTQISILDWSEENGYKSKDGSIDEVKDYNLYNVVVVGGVLRRIGQVYMP